MHAVTVRLDPERPDVTLSALLWEESPALQDASRPRPAILICPGGGYHTIATREADPIAFRFAGMGYHTFVLRYGLHQEGQCLYPRPMLDIARAMLYIRDHAASWRLDAERIGLCGFSAGGHNALLYAVRWDQPFITHHFSRPAADFRPALCIAGYAVVDYMGWPDEACQNEITRAVRDECRRGLFGTAIPDPEKLLEADPTRYVSASTPPMFLWATAEDVKVPAANTLHMALALMRAGIPVETHIFESGEHGLALADPASAGIRRKVEPAAARWSQLCDTWLKKRFALQLMDE